MGKVSEYHKDTWEKKEPSKKELTVNLGNSVSFLFSTWDVPGRKKNKNPITHPMSITAAKAFTARPRNFRIIFFCSFVYFSFAICQPLSL